ncbi:hypothetical protein EGR_11259 [Echinococcus granulosus]|uniref:Uncharacterized protein n=1 Tax=Echinococcus granulosus TaxID=6210 RepID=W6U6B5_ECHGR|nr:hypothetical protein EGR_11259 [Echinococcus granulosus]EUB53887.1 hypothetical protein EGR_11259 [Echinococcus granulosus]
MCKQENSDNGKGMLPPCSALHGVRAIVVVFHPTHPVVDSIFSTTTLGEHDFKRRLREAPKYPPSMVTKVN